MTRINAFIPPESLCDKHLLAEHREIIRIPNQIKKNKLSDIGQPNEFKLGTGHVKFFRDKLKFLHVRYKVLYSECKLRGFDVTDFSESFNNLPNALYNDYNPPVIEINRIKEIISNRIIDRMPKNPKFTRYKKMGNENNQRSSGY